MHYSVFMELNTEKILTELKRLGKNKKWLAEQLGVYPLWITHMLKHKPITQAERIGKALDIDPRDLIK